MATNAAATLFLFDFVSFLDKFKYKINLCQLGRKKEETYEKNIGKMFVFDFGQLAPLVDV